MENRIQACEEQSQKMVELLRAARAAQLTGPWFCKIRQEVQEVLNTMKKAAEWLDEIKAALPSLSPSRKRRATVPQPP